MTLTRFLWTVVGFLLDSLVVGLLVWAVFGTTERTAAIIGVVFGVLSIVSDVVRPTLRRDG